MRQIDDYRIEPNGSIWIRSENGQERRATDREWLSIWRNDPSVTLRLSQL